MLLTKEEKALAALVLLNGSETVHVPVEILDIVQEHGELVFEEDEDGCYNVTVNLEGV